MADNIYALLQQAWSVAKTSDANLYGVEVAIVTNVKDPEKAGRVKVCFPRLPGKPESDWARVVQPSAGSGRGFYWLPEVSDEVLVAFERGQANVPYVLGALWNGKDKPMKDAYTDDNTKRMIQTKSGHQILFEDKSGEEKISIADKSGKRTLTFDVKDKKFLIEAKEGDVEIHAKKKIVLMCEDLEIKTTKTGKITIGTKFDLKVSGKAGFKAGPKMELKASQVNLNPPSLADIALTAAGLRAQQAAAAAAARAAMQTLAHLHGGKGGGAGGAGGAHGGHDLSHDAHHGHAGTAGAHGHGGTGSGHGTGHHGTGGTGHHGTGGSGHGTGHHGTGGTGSGHHGTGGTGSGHHGTGGTGSGHHGTGGTGSGHHGTGGTGSGGTGSGHGTGGTGTAGTGTGGTGTAGTGTAAGGLANPSWGATEIHHGDVVTLRVDARGHDGRSVRFVIEQRAEGGSWEQLAEITATVSSGVARGSVRLEHPAAQHRAEGECHFPQGVDPQPRALRFHASLS